MSLIVDTFGRTVEYLRLSVTDRCDFRCVYCMSEDPCFLERDQVLSLEELAWVGQAFTELGVKKDPLNWRRAAGSHRLRSVS